MWGGQGALAGQVEEDELGGFATDYVDGGLGGVFESVAGGQDVAISFDSAFGDEQVGGATGFERVADGDVGFYTADEKGDVLMNVQISVITAGADYGKKLIESLIGGRLKLLVTGLDALFLIQKAGDDAVDSVRVCLADSGVGFFVLEFVPDGYPDRRTHRPDSLRGRIDRPVRIARRSITRPFPFHNSAHLPDPPASHAGTPPPLLYLSMVDPYERSFVNLLPVPDSPDAITAGWLTAALRESGSIRTAVIESLTLETVGGRPGLIRNLLRPSRNRRPDFEKSLRVG